jgi:hypothetical protein
MVSEGQRTFSAGHNFVRTIAISCGFHSSAPPMRIYLTHHATNYSHKDIEVRDGVLDAKTHQVASVTPLLVELVVADV